MSETFVQDDWSRYAQCYDSLLALQPYVDMLREVAGVVANEKLGHVLDASCGTGNFEKILCMRTPQKFTLVGIDMQTAMLERARAKCMAWQECSFEEANLDTRLRFDDDSFSHIVSLNTLYAVQDPQATLREFYRVLIPHGKVFIVTPHEGYENGLILKEHCRSIHPDAYWAHVHESPEREEKLIREAIADEQMASDMLTVAYFNRNIAHNGAFHFYRPEELTKLLESVGFSITRVSMTYAKQDIFAIAQKGS
jgi:ubiquinone/menaquinone biosynthesis C-methylase UbiE